MKQEQLEHYRQLLIKAEQEELEHTKYLGDLGPETSFKDYLQELSLYDNHPADIGTEVFEQSKDIGLRDRSYLKLKKIKKALEKINEGTYGICEKCGNRITESRLEIVPEAELCLDCQEAKEKLEGPISRPVEEKVIRPLYGGLAWESQENRYEQRVAYDGEDTLKELFSYGTSSDVAHELEEDIENTEEIPYIRGKDGVLYKDFRGNDDEERPGGPI